MPTVLGYWTVGFAAGMLGKVAGLSLAEIGLLSLLVYAGSSQFMVSSMVSVGVSISSIWLTVFFVNLRHLLMTSYLAKFFKEQTLFKSVLIGSQVTDETFGLAASHGKSKKNISFYWMFGANMVAYLNWFFANIVGALVGSIFPSTMLRSFDFALPAMFIALIILQISVSENKITDLTVGLLAGGMVIPLSLLAGKSMAVILAACISSFLGFWMMKWKYT